MMRPLHFIRQISVISFFLLPGCGFQPLYGNVHSSSSSAQAYVQDQMSQIYIDAIPDREGQILYNRLVDTLNRHGYPSNPRYSLKISAITESESSLAISSDDNVTRSQLSLTATMTLVSLETDEALISHSLNTLTSFNVLEGEFATRVSEQSAREDGLSNLAEKIQTRLALFFQRQANTQ